jgi:VWFA-related protein
MMLGSPSPTARLLAALGCGTLLVADSTAQRSAFRLNTDLIAAGTITAQQVPSFRAGVDLVSVDVRVVDRDGQPIPGLAADRFEVSIGGRRRRVVSLDYVVSAPAVAASTTAPAGTSGATAVRPSSGSPTPVAASRLFFLAIDALSFGAGESRGVAVAAQQFIAGLQPSDYVGLLTFPSGPRLNPTRDHAAAAKALDGVVGQRPIATGKFRLRPSEIAAIAARHGGCSDRSPLATTQCDEEVEPTLAAACQNNAGCRKDLINQAQGDARNLENLARTSLGTFGGVIRALANVEAQKVVVLVSAGLIVGQSPGAVPDVGDLPVLIGQEAARANASVYTLFVDQGFMRQMSAETANAPLTMTHLSSDRAVLERWLGEFTGTAGGAFLRVVTGDPESAFRRIVRETAAHYLIGVEPADADRDGRPRPLSVKVNTGQRGSTVRSRAWVTLPKAD